MALTTLRGPLSVHRAGKFNRTVPDSLVYIEPYPRRVRGIRRGETVIDSEHVLLVHRPGRMPSFAVPAQDLLGDLAVELEPEAPGHWCVTVDAVDSWIEEDEPVFAHPRNPYHRVDCLRTSRQLRVELMGTVLVDDCARIALYETTLEPRLYVDRPQVRTDLLVPSRTITSCAYKGRASYWNAQIGDVVVDDVAWCYEDPFAECEPIRGLLCFDDARVTVIDDLPAGCVPADEPSALGTA